MGCSYHMRGYHMRGAARYAVKERLDGVACNHTPKRLLAAAPRLAACALPPRPPLSPVAETAATARGDCDDGARRTARPISLPLWRAPALPRNIVPLLVLFGLIMGVERLEPFMSSEATMEAIAS